MELDKIFESVQSEVMTEDVKKQIATLIEAKVNEKTNEKIQELETLFEEYKEGELVKLEEKAVEYVDSYLVDKIDEYLDYVSEEYMKENKLAIENGVKSQMFEKLVNGMKNVLSESQIEEDEVQKQEMVYTENTELKDDLDKAIKENLQLKRKIKGIESIQVFNEVSEKLSDSETEKLKKLAEDFDIDDIKEFKEKLEILKESLSSSEDDSDSEERDEEKINESVDTFLEIGKREINAVWDDFKGMEEYL